MRNMISKIVVVFLIIAFISSSCAGSAYAQTPIRKLGRGIANMFTGFLELPQGIVDVAEEEGAAAAVTYGVTKGVAMSVLRTGVGMYEIVTFLIVPTLLKEFSHGGTTEKI